MVQAILDGLAWLPKLVKFPQAAAWLFVYMTVLFVGKGLNLHRNKFLKGSQKII